ncbi:unnamed protein product [Heligmosomoides polygyrus]|uniref:Cadherin domain-containing protein n=1 Tax=Heligmosomoides polygyrus TaxID=6339 RepID=A0A183GUL3_HELPZ|nr:unnamed protein product [Heligmosomoides polygyrus]
MEHRLDHSVRMCDASGVVMSFAAVVEVRMKEVNDPPREDMSYECRAQVVNPGQSDMVNSQGVEFHEGAHSRGAYPGPDGGLKGAADTGPKIRDHACDVMENRVESQEMHAVDDSELMQTTLVKIQTQGIPRL